MPLLLHTLIYKWFVGHTKHVYHVYALHLSYYIVSNTNARILKLGRLVNGMDMLTVMPLILNDY